MRQSGLLPEAARKGWDSPQSIKQILEGKEKWKKSGTFFILYLNLGEPSQQTLGWLVKKQSCRRHLDSLGTFLSLFHHITVKKLRENGKNKATEITEKPKIG